MTIPTDNVDEEQLQRPAHWFVESLATQSLIIFAIRTRRIPFFHSTPSTRSRSRSRASRAGVALPYSPFAHVLGFTALPRSRSDRAGRA